MDGLTCISRHINASQLVLALAMLVLALHPATWLFTTWIDPSYNSPGLIIAASCLALLIWSVRSPRLIRAEHASIALPLLLLTSLTRLVSELFAVNVIGGVSLVVDVYAIALLLGVHQRRHALSPFWLAVLFGFSLPLERIVQRCIGYGLQQIAAGGACLTLQRLADGVSCEGVRIFIAGQDVLVDLPCSGARGMILVLILASALMAVRRPRPGRAGLMLLAALASAVVGNTLRIVLLALGIGFSSAIGGIDVMAQPWHDAVGLVCLSLSCLPLLWLARGEAPPPRPEVTSLPRRTEKLRLRYPLAFLLCALVIVNLPGKPVDVAARIHAVSLPSRIEGIKGISAPLTPQEEAYFTQYGGQAVKARYGTRSLMVVRTSSPLRHLHAPDECLRGRGLEVTYMGAQYAPLPTAIYRARTADGADWRVAVTFISGSGEYATNVAEAVWRWMQSPGEWMAVQRITPWSDPMPAAWDSAVMAALDLPMSASTTLSFLTPTP